MGLCTPREARLRSLPISWTSNLLSTEASLTPTTQPWPQTYFLAVFPHPVGSPAPFGYADVVSAINRLRPKWPHGEVPHAGGTQHATPSLISLVHELFNKCLRFHYFISLLKRAKIVIIPKPRNVEILPKNHPRFLSVIKKVFERLLNGRISPLLDGFIRQEQFGLRREHWTILQLVSGYPTDGRQEQTLVLRRSLARR